MNFILTKNNYLGDNKTMEEKKEIPINPSRQTRGELYREVKNLAISLGRPAPDYTRTSMEGLRTLRIELLALRDRTSTAVQSRIRELNEMTRPELWREYRQNNRLPKINYTRTSGASMREALIRYRRSEDIEEGKITEYRTVTRPLLTRIFREREANLNRVVGLSVEIVYQTLNVGGLSPRESVARLKRVYIDGVLQYGQMEQKEGKIHKKTLLINSPSRDIDESSKKLVRRFVESMGGYCLLLGFKYTILTRIPTHTYLTVPLRYSKAPKLEIFNEEGKIILDNINYEDNLCVPHYIKDHIFNKKPLEKIVKEINEIVMSEYEGLQCSTDYMTGQLSYYKSEGKSNGYDCERDGVSLLQFQAYCEKYKLSFRALDYSLNQFMKFNHPNFTRNRPVMMFIIHDGHIYNISDKTTRESIRNTGTNIHKHKNIKESQKQKLSKKTPNGILEFSTENINVLAQNDQMVDLYTTKQEAVLNYFLDRYIAGTYHRHKSVGREMMYCYYKKGCKLIYNEDWVNARKLCDILKIQFNNQTITTLAYDKLNSFQLNLLDKFKSHFNEGSLKFCQCIDSRAISRSFNKPLSDDKENLLSLDINKMYSSILEDENMNWLKVNSLSDPKLYTGQAITNSTLYYIGSVNESIIFPQCGVYYPELVRQGLLDGLISTGDIKYYLDCNVIRTSVFKNFVENVYSTCGDFSKSLINNLIGSLGRVSSEKGSLYYTNDINTACSNFFIKEDTRFVSEVYKNGQTGIYMTDNIKQVDNNRNLFLIRKQIVQQGNLLSYRLSKRMEGRLIHISTDCVTVEYNKNEKRPEIQLSQNRGGYKIEKKMPRLRFPEIDNQERESIDEKFRNKFTIPNQLTYSEIKITDERDVNEIFQAVNNKSVFITGHGGTGKTYISILIKDEYEKQGKRVLTIAPTHIATKATNGKTCHNGLGFDITGKTHISDYSSIDIIFIDEISMVGSQFYNELCLIKKDYPNIIFISVGDFNQLPPVTEENVEFMNTIAFTSLFPFRIILREIKRSGQDGLLLNQLTNDLLNGKNIINNFKTIHIDDMLKYNLHLTFTNETRQLINHAKMLLHSKDKESILIEKSKDIIDDNELSIPSYSQDIILYEGLPLRARYTSRKVEKDAGLIIKNGDQFVVSKFDLELKVVTLQRDESKFANYNPNDKKSFLTVKISNDFTQRFNPSYAMTVHNSQCQSFDIPYVIHEYEKYSIQMLNTAIGRTRKVSHIHFPIGTMGDKVKLSNSEMVLDEDVNLTKLKIINDNFDYLYQKSSLGRFVDSRKGYKAITDMNTIKTIVNRYYAKKTQTNKMFYKYASNKQTGRMFSDGYSLQNISRKIRGCISNGIYTDIDMVNCHVIILKKFCGDNKIECPNLDSYIDDREPKLQELMSLLCIDRDSAKMIPLSLLNGGSGSIMKGDIKVKLTESQEPMWMKGLKSEVLEAYNMFTSTDKGQEVYNRVSKTKKWNIQGSVLNTLFCEEENKLLVSIYRYLSTLGIKTGAFVFDGLMIRTDSFNGQIDELLRDIERELYNKLGYDMKLSHKEFEDIDLSEFELI